MKISNINLDEKVMIVAEIGNCHEGDFSLAEKLISLAADSGADAVKFQTIIPEKLVSSDQKNRIKQLKRFQLSYDDYKNLSIIAKEHNVLFLSTPFDIESVYFLDKIVPAFKIASSDNNFYPLLKTIAMTGKPVIMSTGLSDVEDIIKSKKYIENVWTKSNITQEMILLHCVSAYPTPPKYANLLAINDLKKIGSKIGYSDHTLGIDAAILSVALGARLIEKHFTISKDYSNFRDHQLAADPDEFSQLVKKVRLAECLLGNNLKKIQDCEQNAVIEARRSIAANKQLNKGHIITYDDLTWVRPGYGIAPGRENEIINKKLTKSISMGEPILFDDISE